MPSKLPEIKTLMGQTFLDRHGQPIQVSLNHRDERASFIKLEEIPPWIQLSFILAEDSRFFDHPGFDIFSVMRAIYQAISHLRIISGASTLTMQLARIYWPELAQPQHKLAQIIQALRIENAQNKNEILTHYFNVIPFAHQVIGLKQACLYFYNKSCAQLSLAQGASLAVIPRNPHFYTNNLHELMKARNKIINKISPHLHLDKISKELAYREPIQFDRGKIKTTAYHFTQRILSEKPATPIVHTTLDLHLQNKIQEMLAENIQAHPQLGDAGAILVIENKTGDVLSYIGSPGYFTSDHGMLDAVQTLRSPGSSLKPFVYAYALQRGQSLSSLLPDVPMQFKVDQGVFSPNNYGGNFSGPQQIRYALANSKNIPVLYLTAQLGEASVLNFLRENGLESLNKSPEHYGVGLSLGNGEVSLWELVRAYSHLSRGGMALPLRLIRDKNQYQPKRVFSSEISFLITDVLSDSQARAEEFGQNGALNFNFKVAAKTGTSSSYRDHWVVGYSSDYTVGIWKGNANGSPFALKIPASRGVGPLFQQIFKFLHAENTPPSLTMPPNMTTQRICSLSGQRAGPNCPHTRLEYFRHDHIPDLECSFHREILVNNCYGESKFVSFLEMPDEYHSWMRANYLSTLEDALSRQCGWDLNLIDQFKHQRELPKIISPVSGTILALDPSIPRSHQTLRIQFQNKVATKNSTLLINGQPHAKLYGKMYIDWPIQRGKFEFQIRTDSNMDSELIRINIL